MRHEQTDDTHIGHGERQAGVAVRLFSLENGRHLVASTVTDDDGRTGEPLMEGDTFRSGVYELEFSIGEYFSGAGTSQADPPFLDIVVVRITLANDDHYHVPLLVSPWSYATYRGS
jgi:5-hydroxyisourate hydrolase